MSDCSMHPNHRLPGNARLYVLFTEDEHTRESCGLFKGTFEGTEGINNTLCATCHRTHKHTVVLIQQFMLITLLSFTDSDI